MRLPGLGQVNLVVGEMEATLAFYRRLWSTIDTPSAEHAVALLPNGLRVEFDSPDSARVWNSSYEGALGGSTVLGSHRGNLSDHGPPELQDEEYEDSFAGLPKKDYVLARINLGEANLAYARRRARQLASDVLRAALPDSQWILMGGAASYLQGSGWGGNRFTGADWGARAQFDPPRHEPTTSELAQLDERFGTGLVQADEAALDAVGYVRWGHAVANLPEPAQRIALSLRILERALPRNAETERNWQGATRRYLKETWSERRLGLWLRDASFAMLSAHPGHWETYPSEAGERYRTLNDELIPSAGRLAFYFYGDRALRRLPETASDMDEGSMERRLLDEVHRRAGTGADAAAWLEYFDERFERLLARTARQRNAVLHGATTVPAVLASIESFVSQLTNRVVAEKIHAAATGISVVAAMESARYGALERRARLKRGEHPAQVLFQGRQEHEEP